MIRNRFMASAAIAVAIALSACNASPGASDPNVAVLTAWPEIPEALRNPAPKGARFTPDMTWSSIQQLPKIWGVNWRSPQSYDAKQIALDQLDYPSFKPEFLAQSKARVQDIINGTAEFQQASCKPFGMTRTIWYTAAPTFLFQPGDRLLLGQNEVREIWMDGRPHPDKVDANDNAVKYLGHSIGWWEGETLVIDTVGIHPDHELFYGVPSQGQHVVERWSLVNPNQLKVVLTVDAPKVLAKPWVFEKVYDGGAMGGPGGATSPPPPGGGVEGTRLPSFDCDRGDSRQKVDAEGNLNIDLTPPPPGVH